MKKKIKVAAVLSTAAFLSMCAPLISFASQGWTQENGGWAYYNANGERVTEDWVKEGNHWYWLDENGVMANDGLRQIKDNYYYFREDGSMVSSQWVSIPNEAVAAYVDKYAEETGEVDQEPVRYWYYFQENGRAYKRSDSASSDSISAKTIDGKKYAFDTEGRMLYGWVSDGERQTGDDAWEEADYYFGAPDDGSLHQGWAKVSIHVDDPETEQPGSDYWEEDQNRWFYFTESGKKLKGKPGEARFKNINGNKYGFDEYGRMISTWYADPEVVTLATSKTEAGEGKLYQGQEDYTRQFMYFGTPESGARYTKGWFKARPSEYLMKSKYEDGEMYTYYADGDGNLYANEIRNIDGERYGFDNAGRVISGMTCVKMDDEDSTCDIEYSFGSDATVKEGRGPYEDENSFHELVETYAEDFASGKMRMYYFGGRYGAMSTGKQQIRLGKFGDPIEFMFETSGPLKGSGVHGEKDGRLYKAGMLLKPEEGEKYVIFKESYETLPEGATEEERKVFDKKDVDGDGKLEGVIEKITPEEFIAEVCNSGIYDEKKEETVWTVRYRPEGVTYYLVGANGDIVKNKKNAVDVDGYSFQVKKEDILTVTVED